MVVVSENAGTALAWNSNVQMNLPVNQPSDIQSTIGRVKKLYLVGRYTMDYTRLIPAFIYVAVKPTDSKLELP